MATTDIKIQSRCDHSILYEGLTLQPDRVSFLPSLPIASQGSVILYRFGNVVPQTSYSFRQSQQLVYENKYLKIVLNEPELYTDPVYNITFTTYLQYCPKCLGTEYVDDIHEDSPGIVSLVSGGAQLVQLVEKTIITTMGSNTYYKWAGSGVRTLIGSKITDFQVLSSEIEAKVRQALDNLRTIQLKHQAINPVVSGDEVLGTVEKVIATQDTLDQTIINLFVQYTSQSGANYDYSQVLELTQYRAR
jgi:phage baseplate assembly protein W